MIHVVLQIWGGLFYLLNKLFLGNSEKKDGSSQKWRIKSWIVYIVGLPAWVWIFVSEQDWIAASIEAGGLPAMILGLILAIKGKREQSNLLKVLIKSLDILSLIIIAVGISYSVYIFGGITQITQGLELGVVSGFLTGTYLLARENPKGYLWFILMNVSTGVLMYIQGYPLLCLQQSISLYLVIKAYNIQRKK